MKDAVRLRVIRAALFGEEAVGAALDGPPAVDVGSFVEYVARRRLAGWVAPALASPTLSPRMPAGARVALDAALSAARRRSATIVSEYAEIHDAFGAAGIDCLFLKGLGIGQRFYGDVHRRFQRDVDLLVRSSDVDRAVAVLGAIGFEPEPHRIGEGAVRRGFVRGDSAVDLHWNLRRRARRQLPEDRLWEGTRSFDLDGRTYRTLSDDLMLAFLLISMCGDLRRGACGPRHLLDAYLIARALEPTTDWDAFFARRAAERLERPCVNVAAVVLAVWGCAGEVPGLAGAVLRRRRMVQVRDDREALDLVVRPRESPENEVWFRRAFPYDGFAAWGRMLSLDLPRTLGRWLLPSRRFTLSSE